MSATVPQTTSGCSLARYAEAKRLDPDFLRGLGLTDRRRAGQDVLEIPYWGIDGALLAVRTRLVLGNCPEGTSRFLWRRGDKLNLYGLSHLERIRPSGFVVLVEGESDAHTLWQHAIPALGLPGANSWREEWARYLEGIPIIYVVLEPDAGGRAVEKWLAHSLIRERVRIVRLAGAKDPSELYLSSPDTFLAAFQKCLDDAAPWVELSREESSGARQKALARCSNLANDPDILSRLAQELARSGVVGEARAAKLVFLCLVSRVLTRPVSIVLKGPSSAGKSFLCASVLKFFPASAYYELSATSERALAYSQEPLKHRFLVLFEAVALEKDTAAYLTRSLLSEGRIRYETVEKTRDGLRPRLIEREGPTGLLVTTTAIHLEPELETRLISVPVTDSPEQTAGVMRAAASRSILPVDYEPWRALQTAIELGECSVEIPYSTKLAEMIRPAAVRLRRDFFALLRLIEAHALLHQQSRGRNDAGELVATIEDYAAVRGLVVDLISEGVGSQVSPSTRETVAAVRGLTSSGGTTTNAAIASELRLDKSSASRRVKKALEEGFLKNDEDHRGRPAKLRLGEPLPDDAEILPTPERLTGVAGCTVAPDPGGVAGDHAGGGADAGSLSELVKDDLARERLLEDWAPAVEASPSSNGSESRARAFETAPLPQCELFGVD